MELSIGTQALRLGIFSLLGLGLGLVYDSLRPIRYCSGFSVIWDMVFCLTAAAGCFVLSMDSGRLGLWELMAVLLLFCLYINFLSPLLLPPYMKCFKTFCQICSLLSDKIKKIPIFAKKFFTNG